MKSNAPTLASGGVRSFFKKHSYLVFLLVILCAWMLIMSSLNPRFLRFSNIANVAKRSTESAIIACGLTLVIITGDIDLSVGAIMALSASLCGILYGNGMPFAIVLPIVLVVALAVGLLNAWLVVHVRVQAMIATLATMTALRSIVYGITNGYNISTFPDNFDILYDIEFLDFPIAVFLAIAIGLATQIILSRTKYGRFIFATGSNSRAAIASGISTRKIKYIVFLLSAGLSCVAGLMCAARLSTASPDMGTTTAFDTLTATLLAGTSISGGKGSPMRAILGVFIMEMVVNGLNLIQVSADLQTIFMGLLLIGIVGFDELSSRKVIVHKEAKASA